MSRLGKRGTFDCSGEYFDHLIWEFHHIANYGRFAAVQAEAGRPTTEHSNKS